MPALVTIKLYEKSYARRNVSVFNTQRYWQDRILELREQIALMDEAPLWPA